jgi:hypothetical protein
MKISHDKKLLSIWSLKVRENADFRCELCGKKSGTLNAHHFYGRKSRSTRYWLPNGICLCYTCHKGGTKSAHESPEYFRSEMIKIKGVLWLKELTNRWQQISKPEYEKVKSYLNGDCNNY